MAKLKPCKSCGKEVSKSAKTCPNCGQKLKLGFMMKGLIGFAVLVVIGIIASGGGEDSTEPVSKTASEETSSETDSETNTKEEPAKEVFAINEAVQLGDNVLTVTAVEKSAGSDFDVPKQGHEYVIVSVQIENAGEENITYNPFDFKMANSQGQIVDTGFITVDSDTALSSGELAPGGKVSGTISFEQPAGDAGLQLQYVPSFWSDKTIKVNLQ